MKQPVAAITCRNAERCGIRRPETHQRLGNTTFHVHVKEQRLIEVGLGGLVPLQHVKHVDVIRAGGNWEK